MLWHYAAGAPAAPQRELGRLRASLNATPVQLNLLATASRHWRLQRIRAASIADASAGPWARSLAGVCCAEPVLGLRSTKSAALAAQRQRLAALNVCCGGGGAYLDRLCVPRARWPTHSFCEWPWLPGSHCLLRRAGDAALRPAVFTRIVPAFVATGTHQRRRGRAAFGLRCCAPHNSTRKGRRDDVGTAALSRREAGGAAVARRAIAPRRASAFKLLAFRGARCAGASCLWRCKVARSCTARGVTPAIAASLLATPSLELTLRRSSRATTLRSAKLIRALILPDKSARSRIRPRRVSAVTTSAPAQALAQRRCVAVAATARAAQLARPMQPRMRRRILARRSWRARPSSIPRAGRRAGGAWRAWRMQSQRQ